jgi:hypothetical protein
MGASMRVNSGVLRLVFAALLVSSLSTQALSTSLQAGQVVRNTDFALFGISGLRGIGVGTITVSGIKGSVNRAILVWHGVSGTTTPITQNGRINGIDFVGANIGVSSDNCWNQVSSQAFQADITALITGNGSYTLTDMSNGSAFDPNGASLLIFYNDGDAGNNRDLAVFWGNDSNQVNPFDPDGWQATLSGINYSSGTVNLGLIVSDGQSYSETPYATINGIAFPIPEFAGDTLPRAPGGIDPSGGLWDHWSSPVTSYLSPGLNTLNFDASFASTDCLSLISAIFDLPAGAAAPPQIGDTTASVPALSGFGVGGAGLSAALAGVYALSNRRRLSELDVEQR